MFSYTCVCAHTQRLADYGQLLHLFYFIFLSRSQGKYEAAPCKIGIKIVCLQQASNQLG